MSTEVADIPQPSFTHRAYGIDVEWFGDEGGMIARGHVPDLRFVAACNHLARKEGGLLNIWDDSSTTLEDALTAVSRVWAVPIDPRMFSSDYEWAVSLSDAAESTPGAIPVTVLAP